MVARPGHKQAVFNSGELGPALDSQTELKYYNNGLAHADGVELTPQGGFTNSPGLRRIGEVAPTACRLMPFKSNSGDVYDLVWNATQIEIWGQTARLHSFGHGYNLSQVAELTYAQELNTLLTFHPDVAPQRAFHKAVNDWAVGPMPMEDVPRYDYGGVYTNGVPCEWELDFIGFDVGSPNADNIIFTITVNGQNTIGVRGVGGSVPNMGAIASNIQTAILSLPNVAEGAYCTVTSGGNPYRCKIVFAGIDNQGDGWVVSVRVENKSDAAVLCNRKTAGVVGGEDIISAARGWPRCGAFYQERLLLGGFKSLPNAWMASTTGNYFNFDTRLNTADGAFVVPLTLPGGEAVENIVDDKFLLVMTSEKNYWVAGSSAGLSKTQPPKHVPATEHGVAPHTPVVYNEGAVLYLTRTGDFVGEMRHTDVDGNYTAQDISLLSYHLLRGAKGLAVRRKAAGLSSNMVGVINGDESLVMAYLLREQEVTGFARRSVAGRIKAIHVNGRNEMVVLTERACGSGVARVLERFEHGLLLDDAIDIQLDQPSDVIGNLNLYEGQAIWALADDEVVGPFTVQNGSITLPQPARNLTLGRWQAPRVTSLPVSRMAGPDIWIQRKARIHSVQIMVEDTTSLAVECNGKVYDHPLRRFGGRADVPELKAGYTGLVTVRGFGGYSDAPQITITQVRPGRLTVKSIVLEASL